ncbi:MAG: hydroxyisourate hydrolase [Woeseiaceae bacterium]
MGKLTTHVLDTASGKPGAGVRIRLYGLADGRELLTSAITNSDGRTDSPLLDVKSFQAGTYELEFSIGDYFKANGARQSEPPFLDDVLIRVTLSRDEHYHVPLLASPWSYSTYRGS